MDPVWNAVRQDFRPHHSTLPTSHLQHVLPSSGIKSSADCGLSRCYHDPTYRTGHEIRLNDTKALIRMYWRYQHLNICHSVSAGACSECHNGKRWVLCRLGHEARTVGHINSRLVPQLVFGRDYGV